MVLIREVSCISQGKVGGMSQGEWYQIWKDGWNESGRVVSNR